MRLSDEERAIRAGEEGEPRRFALEQQMAVGRVLVLDRAKGGVASAWMFKEMVESGLAPAALLMNWSNPVMAQGAADITEAVATGDLPEVDPEAGTVRILERAPA
jgi:predicted aconitase with swiveling domain